ncbi:MAG: undecaprenyl-diphosphatase [Acidimicrobiaceae bacterium]|nr:MAG: undecaprenyl-diphosphatase [Acidimicrobiaceae bacterium]
MTAPSTAERSRPRSVAPIVGVALLAVAIAVLALTAGEGPLSVAEAIVLGAVEGITEYLPVSSTGHLLVVERLLGLGEGTAKAAADTYAIAIQMGAIAAVIALYRGRIVQLGRGLAGRDGEGRRILICLFVAFLPSAVIGLVFGTAIKENLFGPWPVVAAWVLGGLFLLVWRPAPGHVTLGTMSTRHAAVIGVAQILAPLTAAIEFSFLLGLATLTAATALDLTKDGRAMLDAYGWKTPLLGSLVAFVTAVLAVRWLVGYMRTRPLAIFGWYRLGVAALTVALLATGAI